MVGDFPIFVLDIVTIFLIITLLVQTYYIYLLSKKISMQNEQISELKEVVYAIYEASKGKNSKVEYHKLSPDGK